MTARGALTVVGQVVGSYFGGPVGGALGGAIGGAIGGEIDGPQSASGPRLSDLKMTTSQYGTPIPYLEGHPRISGNIIWSSDKREIATTTNQGGKGSDATTDVTTYTYEIDVLVLLTANPIGGVTRIWSNSKLVYSALATGDPVANQTTPAWTELIVYIGDASQMPDPTYEAAIGAGNAPAYRTRGTLMLRGLQLGGSGQMPNLTFEVARAVTEGAAPVTVHDFTDNAQYLLVALTNATDQSLEPTTNWTSGDGPYGDQPHPTSPLSGINPVTIIPTDISIWIRKAVNAVVGNNVTVTVYHDNGPTLWVNGVPVTLTPGAAFTSSAVYVATQVLQDVAYRLDDTGPPGGGNRIYAAMRIVAASVTLTPLDEGLDDVVRRLCLRAGLTAPQIDVTALAGTSVKGFAIGQVTSTRQVLEILAGAYLFETVESGGVLKFVRRGGASGLTIPYDSLGATTGDLGEPLPSTRQNDDEAPAQVIVRYSNASDDSQDGAEASDRLVGFGTGVRMIEVPLTLSPAEARKLADVAIMDIAAASLSVGPVSLARDYAQLEPTDVVLLTDVDGSTYRVRILKLTESGGVRTFEGNLDDASVITSVANTSAAGYTFSSTVAAPADTLLQLMDIPILRDADNAVGFYAAAKSDALLWPGAKLLGGTDDVTYTERATFTESAVFGTCTTTLGNYTGGNVVDWANSLTVDVGAGTLSSDTRDNVLTLGTNAALVGNDEIIQFLLATLLSPGVYTLTGLLRGRQGTEWARTGHVAAERFVLLRLAGLRRVANDTNEIGALRYYKGVTLGRALGTAPRYALTNTARGLKPWAPVELRRSSGGTDFTAFLLHLDGTNGSTTFTEVLGRTVTGVGNAQISTAQAKFGGAALLLDGTGDYLTSATGDPFRFAGDFTLEAWFRPASNPGADLLFEGRVSGASATGLAVYRAGGLLRMFTNNADRIQGSTVMTLNTWHHVALTRQDSTMRLFLNGVQEGSNYTSSANFSDGLCFIGSDSVGTNAFNGYVDEFRIMVGQAVYVGAFTPPAAAFPNPAGSSGDITMIWSRRTRLQANFTNGTVPVGEASEAYEVDIFADGTYAVLKRTLTGITTPTATYSAANQVADFGSLQATVYARVYQLSATVGRGTKVEGAL
jgi:hypothetical protein